MYGVEVVTWSVGLKFKLSETDQDVLVLPAKDGFSKYKVVQI